ncbi:MAG: TonB family protein [Acidobacteriota bacterium]|nr:TonB family protein [Acidobacteriota bacterium]
MYFDFEDRHFETPTVESAMSWRECALLSLFAHLVGAFLVVLGPMLPFVQDAAERRAERLVEIAEAEQLTLLRETSDDPTFIFVEPLVDTSAAVPPPQVDLSDLDRVAQAPTQADNPENDLPNAEGNSFEFIETPVPAEGFGPVSRPGDEADPTETPVSEPVDGADDGVSDAPPPETPDATPGDGSAATETLFADAGLQTNSGPLGDRPGTILNKALRGLDSVARNQTFHNLRGETDLYGPDIQFDSKGVDFGSWLRRFRAQIYRNWFIPYAAMSMSGNVVLTFNVHKDGALTDLAIQRPSAVDAFTNSAFNAMRGSNPTYPLPPEYPDDQAFFTVTFYFNERPRGR